MWNFSTQQTCPGRSRTLTKRMLPILLICIYFSAQIIWLVRFLETVLSGFFK